MSPDETRCALPMDWAFVVQLQPGALPAEGRMAGRVEHVTSGWSEYFGSLPELLVFIGRVLDTPRETSTEGPPPRKRGEGTHVWPA